MANLGAIVAHLGAILTNPGAILEPSGLILGHLGTIMAHLWSPCDHLGTILGHLGAIFGHLGPSRAWAILGSAWGHLENQSFQDTPVHFCPWRCFAFLGNFGSQCGVVLSSFARSTDNYLNTFKITLEAMVRPFFDKHEVKR